MQIMWRRLHGMESEGEPGSLRLEEQSQERWLWGMALWGTSTEGSHVDLASWRQMGGYLASIPSMEAMV